MSARRGAVVLFCGNPAKDELQKNLPPRFLTRLHDALLRRLRLLDADVYVARHDDREFRIGDVARPVGTLGNQIDTALRFCFDAGHSRVVIVAGDAAIDPAIVKRALDAREAVIAESGDGGFALAGFSAPPDVDWNAVVADRAHAAHNLRTRCDVVDLPRIDDIDTPEDARRLIRDGSIPRGEHAPFIPPAHPHTYAPSRPAPRAPPAS